MTGVRRWVMATAVAAAVVAGGAPAAHAFSSTDKARVLYVGDSIASEGQDVVANWIQLTGKATVQKDVLGGMAICDFVRGTGASYITAANKVYERVRTFKPHLVILQSWGNSSAYSPCTGGVTRGSRAWKDKYFNDAFAFDSEVSAGASAAGVAKPKVLWVRQGPDAWSTPTAPTSEPLNGIYDWVASYRAGRTSDAGATVALPGNRYGWTQYLPCSQFEKDNGYCPNPAQGARLHRNEDTLHFCLDNPLPTGPCVAKSPGVLRYGMRIAYDANTWLGI